MGKIERLLEAECEKEILELGKLPLGEDAYRTTVDGVTKMADRMIELKKIEIEREKEAKNREFEESYKLRQMEEEKRDRFIKNCITGVGTLGGLTCAVAMGLISMNFEKEGTFTTEAGRNSIRQLLKFKF